jgi:predicted RNA methylase
MVNHPPPAHNERREKEVNGMQVDTRTLEQIQIDLETARGVIASGQLSPDVDEATKLLAASVAAAGAEIALAIAASRD